MILLLIILIFLIRVGIKLTLVGIAVSSYIHGRYKKIQSRINEDEAKAIDSKGTDALSVKTVVKSASKVIKVTSEIVLSLLDTALGILNKLLLAMSVYVIILDVIVCLFLVSIGGYYILYFGDDGNKYGLEATTTTIITGITSGGSSDSGESDGGSEEDGDDGDSGGEEDGGSGGSGGTDSSVYELLAADSSYSSKASALSMVYAQASSRWGRDVAVGLMANVVAEGSPGKIEGINFANAFNNGVISASRKVVLSCGCSKNGTVTIDYWAEAPCSAHVLAGKTISSQNDVSAMKEVGGHVAGIGVGSIQWSGGRRPGILDKYASLSSFSSSNLLMADVQYIMEELNGDYSGVISSCSGKSASECAKIICNNYEKPAGGESAAIARAGIANDLSSKLSSIGK